MSGFCCFFSYRKLLMIGQTVNLINPIIGVNEFQQTTTLNKLEETYTLAEEIILNLDDLALGELMGGNSNDIDLLYDSLLAEIYEVLYGKQGRTIDESNLFYLPNLTASIEENLRITNLNYFATSVIPSFEMNWHHVEWGNLVMKYNKLAIIAARDHGKSYFLSHLVPIWKMYKYVSQKNMLTSVTNSRARDLALCERGFIITNEMELAKELLEIIKGTIEENPILKDKLYPKNRDDWSMIKIKCKNGARLGLKSYGSSFRGRHPHYILVDDFLKDNILYSEMQRKKATDYFHSVIMNAIVPGGQVLVAGTPFHEADLYGDLKESMKRSMKSLDPEIKARSWMVFEYPSIYPNGTVLWETRYGLKDLLQKREDQGNLRFSREHLVRPIVSDSSIFPYDILKNSILGMDNISLCKSRESFPMKFNRVVTACDFAMSSSVGADFSVFGTFGIDEMNRLWLMHIWRGKGKSYGEQLGVMKSINMNFRPDVMILEVNQMQRIFAEGAENSGLPVIPHHTGTNKYNLEEGLPSVALLFERNAIKFPRGDQYSRDMSDIILSELASVTWTDKGKLEGVGEHDDTAMMIWLAKIGATAMSTGFGFSFLG